MNTLVIGDVHGHLDRLAVLLEQEGIIRETSDGEWERINNDVEIVQLGDLGDFDKDGSPTADLFSYEYAREWIDVILWGNHDRAVVDGQHAFTGFQSPSRELYHIMKLYQAEGKYKLAHEAHGWLLTHAGLAQAFRNQRVPDNLKRDPKAFADWANKNDARWFAGQDDYKSVDPDTYPPVDFFAIRDAIGRYRGGRSPVGGILWRDLDEKLFMGFPQIFGHSADYKKHQVRYCWEDAHTRKFDSIPPAVFDKTDKLSYCIDISGKGNQLGDNCLAGIWLPSQKIVRIDLPD